MFLNDAIGRWNHFKTKILCKFLLMILPYQNKVYNNNNNNDGMGWDGVHRFIYFILFYKFAIIKDIN